MQDINKIYNNVNIDQMKKDNVTCLTNIIAEILKY